MIPSSPTPPSGTPRRRRGQPFAMLALLAIAAVFGAGLIGLITTLVFGAAVGEEFSPDRFQRRAFQYFEIPLWGLQVTPLSHEDQTNDLELQLSGEGWVSGGNPAAPRWDLVMAQRGTQPPVQGDAGILCTYLDAEDAEGKLYWLAWSTDHPELAKCLWPEVATLARRRLYLFIPELMAEAAQASSPDDLHRRLRDCIVRQYGELAAIQQRQGNHRTAVELLQEALRHDPENAGLRQQLERSSTSAGTPDALQRGGKQ